MFAAATKKAASARFKQPQLDAEGQEVEVRFLEGKGVEFIAVLLIVRCA